MIAHRFPLIYETRKLFYSQKVYALSKDLPVEKIITCQSNVISQVAIKRSQIFLTSNVISLDQNFIVYIQIQIMGGVIAKIKISI